MTLDSNKHKDQLEIGVVLTPLARIRFSNITDLR